MLAAGSLGAQELRITVLEGEGAINNIRERTARAPVVRVLDDDGRPVADATVNFSVPEYGAGGSFPGGHTTLTATTDQDGRAVGRGLRPNNVAGRFQIRVSASSRGLSATASISQVNVAPAARGGSKTKYIIAAIAAGGAAGAILAVKGGGGSSSTPGAGGSTITPGSPVFGPPR
jgi:hypothetical protein